MKRFFSWYDLFYVFNGFVLIDEEKVKTLSKRKTIFSPAYIKDGKVPFSGHTFNIFLGE